MSKKNLPIQARKRKYATKNMQQSAKNIPGMLKMLIKVLLKHIFVDPQTIQSEMCDTANHVQKSIVFLVV